MTSYPTSDGERDRARIHAVFVLNSDVISTAVIGPCILDGQLTKAVRMFDLDPSNGNHLMTILVPRDLRVGLAFILDEEGHLSAFFYIGVLWFLCDLRFGDFFHFDDGFRNTCKMERDLVKHSWH